MPYLEELYLSREEIPDLNKEFYRNYEDNYWYAKIHMYDYLLENMEEVLEDQKSVSEEDLEDYRRLVKAEFTYMFYHSTEALLGLIRSLTQDGIPWIDLKEARSRKIDDFVENELQSDDFDEELRDVFYPFIQPENREQKEKVEESLDAIWKYLKMIGRMYGDRSVYNEYKHGLRLITSESKIDFEFEDRGDLDEEVIRELEEFEETEDGIAWSVLSGDVLFYLNSSVWHQDKETGKKYWSLSRDLKALEFELHRRICSFNSDLITQVFSIRRHILDLPADGCERARVTMFDEVDLEEVFEPENPLQSFSMNSYFPKGEEDLLVYELR